MPKLADPFKAVVVPLSGATKLVVMPGRGVEFIQGQRAFHVTENEWARLSAFLAAEAEGEGQS
jgi:hypothetical protein